MNVTVDAEATAARALAYPYRRYDHPVLLDPAAPSPGAAGLGRLAIARAAADLGYRQPVTTYTLEFETADGLLRLDERVAVIAAGSNAAPEQLVRKWTKRRPGGIFAVVPASLRGLASVYSAHVTHYGSIPATLHPLRGARADLHLLFVPSSEMGHLDATESLGVNYVLARLDGHEALTAAGAVAAPLAYVSRRGALLEAGRPLALAACAHSGLPCRTMAQEAMLQLACRRLGRAWPVGEFVNALVRDPALRREATWCLAHSAEPWALPDHMIMADVATGGKGGAGGGR